MFTSRSAGNKNAGNKNAGKVGTLYVRTEHSVNPIVVSVAPDRLTTPSGQFFLLSDCIRLGDGLYLIEMTAHALREWTTFSTSLRAVTLSALFDDAGDISHTLKNVVFGGILIICFVLLFQLNGMRASMGDMASQLNQMQAQLVQPVQLQLPGAGR